MIELLVVSGVQEGVMRKVDSSSSDGGGSAGCHSRPSHEPDDYWGDETNGDRHERSSCASVAAWGLVCCVEQEAHRVAI